MFAIELVLNGLMSAAKSLHTFPTEGIPVLSHHNQRAILLIALLTQCTMRTKRLLFHSSCFAHRMQQSHQHSFVQNQLIVRATAQKNWPNAIYEVNKIAAVRFKPITI